MTMTTGAADMFAEPVDVAANITGTGSDRFLFQVCSQRAATLERTGEYYQAAEMWGECRALAATPAERFWCEVRQTRCLKPVPGADSVSRRGHQG